MQNKEENVKRILFTLMLALVVMLTVGVAAAQSPVMLTGEPGYDAYYHAVQPNDSWWGVVNTYRPTLVNRLREENPNMPSDFLYQGQIVKLPNSWFNNPVVKPQALPPPEIATTSKEESSAMPFNPDAFVTSLFLLFIAFVMGAIIYLLAHRSSATPPSPTVINPPVVNITNYPPSNPAEMHVFVHHVHTSVAGTTPPSAA